jgi:hypothetical protein
MHKIADMSKKEQLRSSATETVDVRGVLPDEQTDSLIEVWMARQKGKGNKMKKGQAVLELAKRGLKSEGITE